MWWEAATANLKDCWSIIILNDILYRTIITLKHKYHHFTTALDLHESEIADLFLIGFSFSSFKTRIVSIAVISAGLIGTGP